jgi:formylglycine-generating enzyme required for sulfatase activity
MVFVTVPGTGARFSIWHTRVRDFEAFIKGSGYDATRDMTLVEENGMMRPGLTWQSPGFAQGPTHAVCGVNWEDAKAFCRWLMEEDQDKGLLTREWEYRLPTDVAWSVAVGLGFEPGSTPEEKSGQIGDVYPWGTDWPPPQRAGNYASSMWVDTYPRTSPVGSFAANRFGLFDMGGNVWQWCEDLHAASQERRVLRGASWVSGRRDFLLSSFRRSAPLSDRYDNQGFRCVLAFSS